MEIKIGGKESTKLLIFHSQQKEVLSDFKNSIIPVNKAILSKYQQQIRDAPLTERKGPLLAVKRNYFTTSNNPKEENYKAENQANRVISNYIRKSVHKAEGNIHHKTQSKGIESKKTNTSHKRQNSAPREKTNSAHSQRGPISNKKTLVKVVNRPITSAQTNSPIKQTEEEQRQSGNFNSQKQHLITKSLPKRREYLILYHFSHHPCTYYLLTNHYL